MHPIEIHIQDLQQQLNLLFDYAKATQSMAEQTQIMDHCMVLKCKIKYYKAIKPKYYEFQNFEIEIETINSKLNQWQSS